MVPYMFLFGTVVGLYSLIRRIKGLAGKKAMVYSLTVSAIWSLMLGLRHPSMGVDLGYGREYGYLASFCDLAGKSWWDVLRLESFQNYEKGYLLFNKLVGTLWENQQFFLFSCALVSILPVGIVVGRYSKNCRASFLIYFGLTVFHIVFSGLRQAIAVGIAFYGFRFVTEKNGRQYLFTILLASAFHKSALAAALIYPLYWIKLNRRARLVTAGLLPVLFLCRVPLWNLIVQVTGMSSFAVHNGSVTLLAVFCLIYVYLILFAPETRETGGLVNIHYVSCCLLTLTEVSNVAQRAGYYYMIYTVLLLPAVLEGIKQRKGRQEYTLHYAAAIGGFFLASVYSILHSAWSGAYPFYFFWQIV